MQNFEKPNSERGFAANRNNLNQPYLEIAPQVVEQLENLKFTQQVAEQIAGDIFFVSCGHHNFLPVKGVKNAKI